MEIKEILNIYASIAVTIFVVLVGARMIRTIFLVMTKSGVGGRTKNAIDNPEYRGSAFTVIQSAAKFSTKSNKLYTYGLIFYHIDIIILSLAYALTAFRMIVAAINDHGILDVTTGVIGNNYSMSNILAIVFGSGEPLQATFLYGDFASIYMNFTWGLIILAVVGNLMIIMSRIFQNGGGSVVSDIDPAATGVRVDGINNKSHLIISLIIFGIIWSEILARLHVYENAVYYHAFLGVTILMLVPFTYLIHTVYIPVYLYYAAKRYKYRYIG